MRFGTELTSYFSHLADLGQSSPDAVRCVLHKTDQSDRQTMTPQGISYLGGKETTDTLTMNSNKEIRELKQPEERANVKK